jgi:hypothetical protein
MGFRLPAARPVAQDEQPAQFEFLLEVGHIKERVGIIRRQ